MISEFVQCKLVNYEPVASYVLMISRPKPAGSSGAKLDWFLMRPVYLDLTRLCGLIQTDLTVSCSDSINVP